MTAWFYDQSGKFLQTLDLPDEFVWSGVNARLPERCEPMKVLYPPSDEYQELPHRIFRRVRLNETSAAYEEIV